MDDQTIALKQAEETAMQQVIGKTGSVKADDFSSGNVTFVFPAYGWNSTGGRTAVLPRYLPAYNRSAFYTVRDWTLLQTPLHEGMWAEAVATAVTKAAAWGWEVEGGIALRRKRLQELLMYATAGVFVGWVPFVSAHLRSYLLCGYSVVEIVRESNRYSSRITGINHLNPLRCRLTDNPAKPVEYMDRQGRIHVLDYWQVMIFADQLDPTEGDLGMVESAAQRAYSRITTMEAIHTYLYEKLTGSRPLALEFVQGVTYDRLLDATKSAEAEKDRKGAIMYKGVIVVPVPGDVAIQRVTIPIAEVPDGFEYQEIHDNTAVDYAASIGMDVNDLDPRLAARQALGSGAQSVILDQKTRGKGLSAWRVDWTQQIHRLVAATATTFAWSENNLEDKAREAQGKLTRAQVRKQMIDNGEITGGDARNLAVDDGDLPKEFLQTDRTAGGTADSSDNPEAQDEQVAQEAQAGRPETVPPAAEPEPAQAEKASKDEEEEAIRRILAERQEAIRAVRPLVQTAELQLGVED
jgi:hypothetical protein